MSCSMPGVRWDSRSSSPQTEPLTCQSKAGRSQLCSWAAGSEWPCLSSRLGQGDLRRFPSHLNPSVSLWFRAFSLFLPFPPEVSSCWFGFFPVYAVLPSVGCSGKEEYEARKLQALLRSYVQPVLQDGGVPPTNQWASLTQMEGITLRACSTVDSVDFGFIWRIPQQSEWILHLTKSTEIRCKPVFPVIALISPNIFSPPEKNIFDSISIFCKGKCFI